MNLRPRELNNMNTLTNLTDVEIDEILSGTVDGVDPTSQETAMAHELKALRAQLAELRRQEPVAFQARRIGEADWHCLFSPDHADELKARKRTGHTWEFNPLYSAPVPQAVSQPTLADETRAFLEFWNDLNAGDAEYTESDRQIAMGAWLKRASIFEGASQPYTVPDGYRLCLVPMEHTEAFNSACSAAFEESKAGTGPCGVFIAGHRAMLQSGDKS